MTDTHKFSYINKGEDINVKELVEDIRKNITDELRTLDSQVPVMKNALVSENFDNLNVGALKDSEDRRFLNLNYSKHSLDNFNPKTHRKGILGKFVVKLKRKLAKYIEDILEPERKIQDEFNVHLIRYLNTISEYVDNRDSSIFWELVNKIDIDINNSMRRIEAISLEHDTHLHRLNRKIENETLKASDKIKLLSDNYSERINTLESITDGLERILSLAQSSSKKKAVEQEITEESIKSYPDTSYIRLENRFRGSEESVTKRISDYTSLFKNSEKAVLDIGCGRGELLEQFAMENISAKGIDIDKAMVSHCQSKSLDVQHADALRFLEDKENMFGGIIAVEVVEHLTLDQLQKLLSLCCTSIVRGGTLVLETINPKSLLSLSSNYFRDPTHKFPLHPDTLAYMINNSGFKVADVQYRSPVPDSTKLKKYKNTDYMTPKWVEFNEHFNQQIDQLNDLLYGFQEFAIVAVRA